MLLYFLLLVLKDQTYADHMQFFFFFSPAAAAQGGGLSIIHGISAL